MANELRAAYTPGSTTVRARIINPAGLWWNGTTFAAYASGSYSTYLVTMTEQGASGIFVADMPALITTPGTYDYFVHIGTAEGDALCGTGRIDWTGVSSAVSATGGMSGSDFYAYLLRRGFKRTDKATEVYEAITDAIQELRRRFQFSEAQTEAVSTDTIATLGDYKLAIESDQGFLTDVILEDDAQGTELIKLSRAEFNEIYEDHAVTADRGYPKHYCVYGDQIYIGPIPDSIAYDYRLNYSKRAGTITSSSASVPFTSLYRGPLCNLVFAYLYSDLEEYDKAGFYRSNFEGDFITMTRRERINNGEVGGVMEYRDI